MCGPRESAQGTILQGTVTRAQLPRQVSTQIKAQMSVSITSQ